MATETFRYPRRFKAMTAFSAVVFAALAVMLLKWLEIGPIRQPELFAAIMLTLGVSLTWCVAMFRRAADEVVVDDSSIVYRVQMENFARLRQIVRERTVPPATAGPPQRVFARSLGSVFLSLHWPLIVVMVCAWAWRQGAPRAMYGVLWGVAWGLWSVLAPPWRVRLLDDVVAVDWFGWSRKIPYADIVTVRVKDLKNIPDKETTGGIATVLIETARGSVIQLANFRDGSFALFRALDEAWKRGGPPT